MNSQQRKTALRLGIAAAALLFVGLFLLWVELVAVAQGGDSTISRLFWGLWANEPWVVLLVSHTLAAPFWFLAGHFFGQRKSVYDSIRAERKE